MKVTQVDGTTFRTKKHVLQFDTENPKLAAAGTTPMYPFIVKDNPELTEKLRSAVKKKFIPKRDFFLAAVAMLKMLKYNHLEPLTSPEEYEALCAAFEKKYGSQPEFTMRDWGTRTKPEHTAKINHADLMHVKYEKARTADQARAKVLKAILGTV